VVAAREDFTLDYVSFVAYSSATALLFRFVIWCANNQDKVILTNRSLHERRELITWLNIPLIKGYIDSIGSQRGTKVSDPRSMLIVTPRIRDEYLRNAFGSPHRLLRTHGVYPDKDLLRVIYHESASTSGRQHKDAGTASHGVSICT